MSIIKFTGCQCESGILRKSEFKEKKEELFVFGYSCKLFRDDDKALHIDQGKHLIPWMGDETLKIDRYDARGALHDLSALEAPSGGFDCRVELTKAELDVEQLCDEERYRALHTDEDEEEMYKEEELKRLHAAGYGQVGFNYDTPAESMTESQAVEVEEPFEPTADFQALLPANTVLPETQKQNAIIEKTAKFIANQGAQMEILIKAKQGDNAQFKFLNKDSPLHPYYTTLIALVKAEKWPEKKIETVEEKQQDMNDDYLHPSLASTVIESAPSIPSIHYKPSADCDYTLLISKMRGETTMEEPYSAELAPGEVAPPGTEPLPPRTNAEITKPPVMYNRNAQATANPDVQQYTAYYNQYLSQVQPQTPPVQQQPKKPILATTKSTGLSLMKNYNTDSDTDDSDFDDSSSSDSKDKPVIVIPPDDVKLVIDKMAAYVARNGDEFEDIVRSKDDPRFTFLEPNDIYHPFYKKLMQEKRGVDVNGKNKQKHDKAPVSFSIKKHKEPDPVLPKPALPYESSSDDEENDKEATDKPEEPPKELPKTNIPQVYTVNNIPPIVVYKMEAIQVNNLPLIKTIEPPNHIAQKPIIPEVIEPVIKDIPVKEPPVLVKQPVPIKVEEKPLPIKVVEKVVPKFEVKKEKTPERREERVKEKERRSPSRDKKKHRDRKKDYRSEYKSDHKDRRAEKNVEREKERERKREREIERQYERDRKRKKHREVIETEIISLEDNSDEMIDLTGEQSDTKADGSPESVQPRSRRRQRAVEVLRAAGLHPAAAALPATSLASAMVDTLESLRKKKSEEEDKRRRREKRRRRDKRDYEDETDKHRKSKRKKNRSSDEEDSDYEGSKKKKRKKDKKHTSKTKKKRRREIEETEPETTLNIDLTNTLKELRTSPTKELGLKVIEELPSRQDSSEEEGEKKKKKEREYSEGEWSSDSGEDSLSSDKE